MLTVARIERPTPGFVRLTLVGSALEGFQSLSFDDHVKLMLAQPDGSLQMRDITPRAFDAGRLELQIEIALHGHSPASSWAARVQVGEAVEIGGPRGSMIIPLDHAWHLLAGDASALPAIARRLEELPVGSRAIVLVHVDDELDERPLPSAAAVRVQWVRSADAWLRALQAEVLPPGDGFVWCAGEAKVMAQARELLVTHHRQPREAMRVVAYWKQGAPAFHEPLEG